MLQEIQQAPSVIETLLLENTNALQNVARAIRERQPRFAMTVARGSSDHAALFYKYVLESQLGLVTASATPSTTTLYGATPHLRDALVIAISQSGQSPDVVTTLAAARAMGALTVAVVNHNDSPLAQSAEFVLPMQAGPEHAVAATKSVVASMVMALALVATINQDQALHTALHALPNALQKNLETETSIRDHSRAQQHMHSAVTLARGHHFAPALETALKLKETCVLHAEAFSVAEFAHGPIILIEPGFPVLAFQARDASAASTFERYQDLKKRGANLILIGDTTQNPGAATLLPAAATGHDLSDPISSLVVAYLFAAHLSLARGYDPDAPRTLSKVTRTL